MTLSTQGDLSQVYNFQETQLAQGERVRWHTPIQTGSTSIPCQVVFLERKLSWDQEAEMDIQAGREVEIENVEELREYLSGGP